MTFVIFVQRYRIDRTEIQKALACTTETGFISHHIFERVLSLLTSRGETWSFERSRFFCESESSNYKSPILCKITQNFRTSLPHQKLTNSLLPLLYEVRSLIFFSSVYYNAVDFYYFCFRINKKIPRGPPSPPAPVMHSPTRKVFFVIYCNNS